jgi:hypothetical protein
MAVFWAYCWILKHTSLLIGVLTMIYTKSGMLMSTLILDTKIMQYMLIIKHAHEDTKLTGMLMSTRIYTRKSCSILINMLMSILLDFGTYKLAQERAHWLIPNQKPRKHFESGGAYWPKGALLYMFKIKRFYVGSRAERKFLKIWSSFN